MWVFHLLPICGYLRISFSRILLEGVLGISDSFAYCCEYVQDIHCLRLSLPFLSFLSAVCLFLPLHQSVLNLQACTNHCSRIWIVWLSLLLLLVSDSCSLSIPKVFQHPTVCYRTFCSGILLLTLPYSQKLPWPCCVWMQCSLDGISIQLCHDHFQLHI